MPLGAVDILIRTYYKDLDWLELCLKSIRRFARGFREIVVVVPHASEGALKRRRLTPDRVLLCNNYRDDYLGQQVTKLSADELTNADFIAHLDADCVFVRPTTPADLFEGGRPRVLMTPYSVHPRNGPWRIPWQGVTERFLARPVLSNFMQAMPLVYPRWLYRELREFARWQHGCSLSAYVLRQRARCFSEFNALGAYAYFFHRDSFHWVNTATDPLPPACTRIFWSWNGVTEETRRCVQPLLEPGGP
jgi:hypothetical protein